MSDDSELEAERAAFKRYVLDPIELVREEKAATAPSKGPAMSSRILPRRVELEVRDLEDRLYNAQQRIVELEEEVEQWRSLASSMSSEQTDSGKS